jgi:hypothetical protein
MINNQIKLILSVLVHHTQYKHETKTRAPLGGALYAQKCFFFSKDEAFVRHGN